MSCLELLKENVRVLGAYERVSSTLEETLSLDLQVGYSDMFLSNVID